MSCEAAVFECQLKIGILNVNIMLIKLVISLEEVYRGCFYNMLRQTVLGTDNSLRAELYGLMNDLFSIKKSSRSSLLKFLLVSLSSH